MTTLSFDDSYNSRPVSIIKGGKYNKKLVFLNENFSSTNAPKQEINYSRYEKMLRDFKPRERVVIFRQMEEAIEKGITPAQFMGPDIVKQIYKLVTEDKAQLKSIKLEGDAQFEVIPTADPDKTDRFYIVGQTGSGKSYIARQIIENYHRMYPDRSIYLISKLSEDETLDASKAPIKRINPFSFLEDKPEMEEFENSIVIFDDYENFDKKLGDIVYQLIEDIATMGRHHHTSLITCGHQLTNYKKSRLLLNECNFVIVYPHGASAHGLKYLLGTHVGLDKNQISDLKKLGRWACIAKNYPQYVISQHELKLLH